MSGNSADYSGGGGIYCGYSNPTISGNTLSGNSANYGGGIYCDYSNPTISGNTLSGNSAYSGGGIRCYQSSPSISGNTLSGNSADYGGGIYFNGSSPDTVEFNEISGNTASGNGGGIYLNSSSPTMNKNTVAGNSAAQGGGLYSSSSAPLLNNCILWGNAPQQIYQTPGSNPAVTYSSIQEFWPGLGNINQDPLFENPGQNNYLLQLGSPCIDTGNPDPIYNDPDGTRADMGCWYYGSPGAVKPGDEQRPYEWSLLPNYPNPFNPVTTIPFNLAVAGHVSLKVFDLSGREVATLADGWRLPGFQEVTFEAAGLASGVYLARLQAGNFSQTQKMVLAK